MRITAVQTAVVEANYDWTFVRLRTDDDALSGLGECYTAPGLTRIVADLAPLLVGEDPRDVDRLWTKLRWGASGAGSVAGIVWNAISGIEAALWDLVGKAYGVPIHRLLGGRFRDTVRVYADCHAGEALEALDATMVPRPPRWAAAEEVADPAAIRHPEHGRAHVMGEAGETFTPAMYAARAKEVAEERGFSALKFDLDVPTPHVQDTASGTLTRGEIAAMVELAAAAVDAVPTDVEVAFDCHWRYRVGDARRLAHALEDVGVLWLEDPIPPEDIPGLARVAAGTAVPIAAGENWYLRHGFREALETGAVSVASPDVQKCGGLLETRRIADLADVHEVAVAPHCIASPIGTVAAAHVAAAIPNFLALEWHGMSVPFWEDLAVGLDHPVIERGRIRVPEAPGLGVELNEELAREYARPGEPFFGEPA